jgi:hypothetical protein
MIIIFYLKGAVRIEWRVPQPDIFNFQIMVKMIRADGQFLAEGVYIQANEIAAIMVRHDREDEDALPLVHRRGKVERLIS